MSMQLVVFALDKEEYGIDVSAINGILRSKKFTIAPIPGTPRIIEGMINVRGTINYVLNLRTKFGLSQKPIDEESKFIMLNVAASNVSCLVDDITDIVKLEDGDLQPAPSFVRGENAKYIKGIGKIGERMLIILDPNNILSFDEYASIETADTACR